MSAVDLFCGVGGKTHGFLQAGLPVRVGVDIDPSCRYAYETNNPGARFVQGDVAALGPDQVAAWYPPGATRVLVGCAPCQPFSKYTFRYTGAAETARAQHTDARWGLLDAIRLLIEGLLPEVVALENVPQLHQLRHEVYTDLLSALHSMGYQVDARVVRCSDYGVPQTRERLIVLASRLGPIRLTDPRPAPRLTVRGQIGHLPPITAGGPPSADDPLHRSCGLSELNLRRVRATPEGGGWQDWPEELKLACHRRASGKTYPSVYGRMGWDDLAPTITTQCYGLGNGRFGHPEQDRAISLREAALLQTFPPDYRFVPEGAPVRFNKIGMQIGNAVPVALGRAVAESILTHLHALLDFQGEGMRAAQ